jgi:hypothetical protein
MSHQAYSLSIRMTVKPIQECVDFAMIDKSEKPWSDGCRDRLRWRAMVG